LLKGDDMMKKIATIILLCGISSIACAHNLPADNGFVTGVGHVLSAPDHWLAMLVAGIVMARLDINVFSFTAVVIGSLLVMHGFHPQLGYWPLFAFLAGVFGCSVAVIFAGRAIGRRILFRPQH
jgi:hydrogenase/urease accessory protein HupE